MTAATVFRILFSLWTFVSHPMVERMNNKKDFFQGWNMSIKVKRSWNGHWTKTFMVKWQCDNWLSWPYLDGEQNYMWTFILFTSMHIPFLWDYSNSQHYPSLPWWTIRQMLKCLRKRHNRWEIWEAWWYQAYAIENDCRHWHWSVCYW